MSLYGKEKVWFLVNRLLDEREVTSAGQPVALHPANDLNKHYLPQDLINIADKLEKEHNAVKLLNVAPTDQTYGKYLFELLPDFDNYVLELREDPKYLDWIGEKPDNIERNKALGLDELDEDLVNWQNLELLAQFVIRICTIYDAFFENKENLKEDEHLNTLYVALVIKVDRLLENLKLTELRSKRPKLHKSFLGRLSEISKEYDKNFRTQLWHFYDEASHLSAEFTADTGGLKLADPTIDYFLEDIDASIEKHKALPTGLDDPTKHSEPLQTPSGKVRFDIKTSTLILGNKSCDIPDETLEHYICKLTFKNRNVAALEDDILEKSVKSQNSQRAVYDAMLRVNKKVRADLGIEKLLVYKAAKLRINKKYQ